MNHRNKGFAPHSAKWIWLPAARTLPNTFALFRFTFHLESIPSELKGFICADSRYELRFNGTRVQWGPAPCDPRSMEADSFDLAQHARLGLNTIAVKVLYYGNPEGTWPFGKPGLICWTLDGRISTNSGWRCMVDRSQQPGSAPRWYLRSLQEKRDLRLEPENWDQPDFNDSHWLLSKELSIDSSRTPSGGTEGVYHQDWIIWDEEATNLTERSIPLMKETSLDLGPPVESHSLAWHRPPEDWFDFRIPSFKIQPTTDERKLLLRSDEGRAFRFDLEKESVGFPWVEITAPAGTVVQLICQESVNPKNSGWLENHFHHFSQFTCREGRQKLEAFDYEALKHLQVHICNAPGEVILHAVGVRLRELTWTSQPEFKVSDPSLQRLFEANVQTLRNSIQDIVVDGMARERQQYSGDCGHQLTFVQPLFNSPAIFAKFLRTYAKGQLPSGVFMDSWPCADRMNRLWQKPLGLTSWGPIIDHSIGFCFDHFEYWMAADDLEPIRENWHRLLKLARFLEANRTEGILDAEILSQGPYSVWMDHLAYRSQAEKSLALTLYAAAACSHALAPLAAALQQPDDEVWLKELAESLVAASQEKWWSWEEGVFLNAKDGQMDDRSLATALLFDQAPGPSDKIAEVLADRPANLGLSYPANTPWLYRALIKAGRVDSAVQDLKNRWVDLPSVVLNGTLQEMWDIETGSIHLMSHCSAGPLTVLFGGILGLTPLAPGWRRYELSPMLSGLESVTVTLHFPQGVLVFSLNQHECLVEAPPDCIGRIKIAGELKDLVPGSLNRFSL